MSANHPENRLVRVAACFDPDRVAAFCDKWKITEMDLFGSALREDFRDDSDIDVLVTFAPESKWSLKERLDMESELRVILGRDVDIVEKRLVESSENYIRREHILGSARPVYVAG